MTDVTGQEADRGRSAASDQSLINTLKQARLNLDLSLAGIAGGPDVADAVSLLQRRLMADTNSGCNTSCCGGGGSGCLGALPQVETAGRPITENPT